MNVSILYSLKYRFQVFYSLNRFLPSLRIQIFLLFKNYLNNFTESVAFKLHNNSYKSDRINNSENHKRLKLPLKTFLIHSLII